VPLFPELRPFLDEAFSMAEEGETWVVPMLNGDADKNLGTTFRKIVRRAGVEVWPKPFQNLRASRQTELEQHFATYKVCAWLGNTPTIAYKHYLTVTDDDFDSAVATKTGDWLGMQTPAEARRESHAKSRDVHNVQENASFSEVVAILEDSRVAEEGLEQNDITGSQKSNLRQSADSFGTESGTLQDETGTFPPDLAVVVEAWPDLPDAVREAVLRIVAEARQGDEVGSP
jgi:hypothetical protein